MNICIFAGRLGRDPEMQYTPAGTALTKLSLAVSEYAGKDENGKSAYETLWVDVTAWGKLAENTNNILSKGDSVTFQCSYQKRKYTTKEGTSGTSHNFKLEGFTKQSSSAKKEPIVAGFDPEDFSGDIPF